MSSHGADERRGFPFYLLEVFASRPLEGNLDAATGSAVGPLCALAHRDLGLESVMVTQGVEMGSPSQLEARWAGDHPVVAGTVRLVTRGEIELPVSRA